MSELQLFSNNAFSLLAEEISPTSTSLKLMDGYGANFPNPGPNQYFLVTLENQNTSTREIIKVTSRINDTLYFDLNNRGQEGTIVRGWTVGVGRDTLVDHRATAGTHQRSLNPLPEDVVHGGSSIAPVVISSGNTVDLNSVEYSQHQRTFSYIVSILDLSNFNCGSLQIHATISGNLLNNSEECSWNSVRLADVPIGIFAFSIDAQTKQLTLSWHNTGATDVSVQWTRIQHLP